MPSFVSRVLRLILKLVLAVFAAILAICLLAVALIVVLFSIMKSLITGRKPAPAMVFGRFQQYSPQGMWPGSGTAESKPQGDIVDVEVREVRDERRLP
ncbi:MAG: hypothetical protein EOO28_20260 [Comamonadaceae bacterium]|nr:MAG: hypothetical protein EOO28_20260 [Comamonadaceae bacterium]